MSENYTWREELKANFQLNILENTSSLHYIFKQRAGTYLVLKIPHKALLKWRELKQVIVIISYLELLQVTASNLPIMFKNGNERLEECLRILAAKTYSQSRGLRGNKRVSFCNQTKSVQVNLEELVNVCGLQIRLQKCEEDKKELEDQVQDLETRCEDLLQEIVDEKTRVKNLEYLLT